MSATIEWYDGPREALAELFAEADDSPAAVRAYRHLVRVLVARDGDELVGELLLADGEVKSLAVRPQRRGEGIGRMLLERAAAAAREEGRSALVLGTAAADTAVLRFYQRLGFRMLGVERDAFTAAAGYPEAEVDGIPLRDRVWLSLDL